VTDFDELAAGLRTWAKGDWINTAAVELLIGHETWLRRGDFPAAAIEGDAEMADIDWRKAKEFLADPPACSTTELAVLRLAVAIGADDYRLASMGSKNAHLIIRAFTTALHNGLASRG
jgi:hypothetical protein